MTCVAFVRLGQGIGPKPRILQPGVSQPACSVFLDGTDTYEVACSTHVGQRLFAAQGLGLQVRMAAGASIAQVHFQIRLR